MKVIHKNVLIILLIVLSVICERKFGENVVMPNIFGIILQYIYNKPTYYT